MEISRRSAHSSGGSWTRIRRTKQSRKIGRRPKRRRSSGGSRLIPSRTAGDSARLRIVDRTVSISRLRREMFSQASIPSSTASSAVLVAPPRSKAVRNAVCTAHDVVSITVNLNLSVPQRALRHRAVSGDAARARMSRFSKTRPPVSCVSRRATSTMARAKSSAGIT